MRTHKLFIPLFILGSIAACNDDSSTPDVVTMPAPIPAPAPPEPEPEPAGPCEAVACEDNNKVLVVQIYEDIINGGQTGLVDSLFDEDFTQHSEDIMAGIEGLSSYYDGLLMDNPNHEASVKHIVADGDYVAVHWHYSNAPEDEFTGTAHVDLFKLFDDQIIEMRPYSMTPNAVTASGNSVFSDLYDYGSAHANNDVQIEEDNKTLVTDFYIEAFNNNNVALIDNTIDENYIQHNYFVPNGRGALRNFVGNSPAANISVFLSLAEDDLVWTFRDDAPVVDLWRVDNNTNKIVEHWDVF